MQSSLFDDGSNYLCVIYEVHLHIEWCGPCRLLDNLRHTRCLLLWRWSRWVCLFHTIFRTDFSHFTLLFISFSFPFSKILNLDAYLMQWISLDITVDQDIPKNMQSSRTTRSFVYLLLVLVFLDSGRDCGQNICYCWFLVNWFRKKKKNFQLLQVM